LKNQKEKSHLFLIHLEDEKGVGGAGKGGGCENCKGISFAYRRRKWGERGLHNLKTRIETI